MTQTRLPAGPLAAEQSSPQWPPTDRPQGRGAPAPPTAPSWREEPGLCQEAANRLLSCQLGAHSSGCNPMTSGGDRAPSQRRAKGTPTVCVSFRNCALRTQPDLRLSEVTPNSAFINTPTGAGRHSVYRAALHVCTHRHTHVHVHTHDTHALTSTLHSFRVRRGRGVGLVRASTMFPWRQ